MDQVARMTTSMKQSKPNLLLCCSIMLTTERDKSQTICREAQHGCKFAAKENVMQSFFLIVTAEHTIRIGNVEALSTQKIPCVKSVIEQ
jgi:hypothetical protein